ncbi:hypothetical protein GGF44_001471 [Coemansia sp. RSA 1694]|nr:hypothetical protein GGF44_001471 [Coemansia sp. RSA 1694]
MQFIAFSTILAVSALMSLQTSIIGVLGTAIVPIATPLWSEAPQITKAVLANVEANLSRFVPHMLSQAKMAELAAVMQGLRPAQARSAPTAAVADQFWNGAEVTVA